jgi:hypothetical protein
MNMRLPMNRKLLSLIFVGISAASMAACGGSNNSNGISIGFSQAPPAAMQTSASISVDAVVVNDTSNKGVDWTVTCGSSDCGLIAPTHTDSGTATTYTAPASVPTGNTVTITATATASSSATTTGTVTITSGSTGTALNGQYAFSVSGADTTGFYVAVGSVVADGNGNITSGEEDLCDLAQCFTAVLSGTFSTGSDNRGSITVNSTTLGPQTLQMVVTSSSHALIIEFDGSATSSGTLDLQDMTALNASAISGNYSMAVNGLDIATSGNAFPAALGGIMTADGVGGFTNVTLDINDGGGPIQPDTTVLGATSGPDAFGRVVISDSQLQFVYYIVNAKALRFLEADGTFLTGGSAYTQGTGSLTVANLAGTSVFTDVGETTSGSNSLGLAGKMTVDNNGNGTAGFMDVNEGGSVSSGSITGSTFTGFSAARGMLTLGGNVASTVANFQVYLVDPGVNILDPTNSTGGGGALLLDSDNSAVGTGAIVPQSSGTQFNGNYGLNLQAFTTSTSSNAVCVECDLVAQVSATTSASLTGTGDLNNSLNLVPVQAITGSLTPDGSNPGRITGSLTIGTFGTFNVTYYQATNSQLVLVETDTGQVGTGVVVAQQ